MPFRKSPRETWAGRRAGKGEFSVRAGGERRFGPKYTRDFITGKIKTTRRDETKKLHHPDNRGEEADNGSYL
ncbi:MAG: hypothetical protein AABW99_00800 [archaeon]